MSVQTSYTENIRAAVVGMIADMSVAVVHTRIVETEAGIGFGLAVGQGEEDGGAVLGGALSGFSGISVRDVTLESKDEDTYQEGAEIGVIVQGPIWVTAGADVEAGQAVHYNATTGALTNSGGSGPIVGARWLDSAATGELARVYLGGGMPGAAA